MLFPCAEGAALEAKNEGFGEKTQVGRKKLKSSAKNTIYSIGLSFGKRTRHSHIKRGWAAGAARHTETVLQPRTGAHSQEATDRK